MRPRQAALAAALREHAIREGTFTLSSGATSTWYLDGRAVTFRGDCFELVGEAVLEAVGDLSFDAVGGMAVGAVPVALAVAFVAGRRAFAVRPEAKSHGIAGRIAGPLQRADRALVVEDTATSGASLAAAVDAVVAFGARVVAGVVLVDRGGAVAERLAARGVTCRAVLTATDLGYPMGS
jgi:orotate phosphoribosyltransferase